MSRIGKLPIKIPEGVEVTVDKGLVTVKGPKGQLQQQIAPEMIIEIKDGYIYVNRPSDERKYRAFNADAN